MLSVLKNEKARPILQRFFILVTLCAVALASQAQQAHEHRVQQREDRHRDRWYWQMPYRVMREIGVKPGMTIADVGAGDGYFTFHLSDRVGPGGKVYASDIDDDALKVIRDKCLQDGIKNITVILGKSDDPELPRQSMDLVLMVNVIHLVKEPTTFLHNVRNSLKPGGPLVLVQWDADKMGREMEGWDPEDRARYTLRANLRTIYAAGFEVEQIKDFLPMQLIYICRPKDEESFTRPDFMYRSPDQEETGETRVSRHRVKNRSEFKLY